MGNTNSSVSEDTDFFNNEGENPQVEVPHDPKHFVPTENAAREVQVLKNVKTESVSEDVWEIKIAVVGDEGVGKSSIIMRALTNKYDKLKPTIGIDEKKIKYASGSLPFTFRFMDIPGADKYRESTISAWSKALVVVQVYDVTDRGSFEAIKTKYLEELDNIEEYSVVLIIGNKSDSERTVTFEEGKHYADEYGFAFLETSAQYGTNCNRVCEIIATELRKQLEPTETETETGPSELTDEPALERMDSHILSPSSPVSPSLFTTKRNGVYIGSLRNKTITPVRVGVREWKKYMYLIIQGIKQQWFGKKTCKYDIKSITSISYDIDRLFIEFVCSSETVAFSIRSVVEFRSLLLDIAAHYSGPIVTRSNQVEQVTTIYSSICKQLKITPTIQVENLTNLHLQQVLTTEQSISALCEILKWTSMIRVLNVANNHLSNASIQKLCTSLVHNKYLTRLVLDENAFDEKGCQFVADYLVDESCGLTSLGMNNMNLGDAIIPIVGSLVDNDSLYQLEFRNCNLNNEILGKIETILAIIQNLEQPITLLDLRENGNIGATRVSSLNEKFSWLTIAAYHQPLEIEMPENWQLNPKLLKVEESTYNGDRVTISQYDLGQVELSFLRNDMRRLVTIEHKNLVSYKGCSVDVQESKLHIISQNDLPTTLHQYLSNQRGTLEAIDRLNTMIQVAEGLQALHKLDIVHGSLTNQIVYTNDDFSQVRIGNHILGIGTLRTITQQSSITDGAVFFPPELALGRALELANDIYSLGVIMFELWFDQLASFEEETINYLDGVSRQKRPDVPAYCITNVSGVDKMIVDLIRECWEENPDDRPEIGDVLDLLAGAKHKIVKGST